ILTVRSVKARTPAQYTNDTTAVQGFAHAIILVTACCCPQIVAEPGGDSELGDEKLTIEEIVKGVCGSSLKINVVTTKNLELTGQVSLALPSCYASVRSILCPDHDIERVKDHFDQVTSSLKELVGAELAELKRMLRHDNADGAITTSTAPSAAKPNDGGIGEGGPTNVNNVLSLDARPEAPIIHTSSHLLNDDVLRDIEDSTSFSLNEVSTELPMFKDPGRFVLTSAEKALTGASERGELSLAEPIVKTLVPLLEELARLASRVAHFKHAPKLFESLGLTHAIPNFVTELLNKAMHIPAIRFMLYFKVENNSSPLEFLKEQIINLRLSAKENRRYESQADAATMRDIMELIEDFKLEIDIPVDLIFKFMVPREIQNLPVQSPSDTVFQSSCIATDGSNPSLPTSFDAAPDQPLETYQAGGSTEFQGQSSHQAGSKRPRVVEDPEGSRPVIRPCFNRPPGFGRF
ncbi:unnamed protein product, partial [Brassica oleracea var. botrytis]